MARKVSKQTINDRLIEINAEESERYVADDERRRVYFAEHPTQIACFKCMDGRVHMPTVTGTPRGIVKPYRAIGGKFRVFWPTLRKRFRTWIELGLDSGKRSLALVTYHGSASDPHLGCAGWGYDTAAAKAHAVALCDRMTEVYGAFALTAIPTSVETDSDELTLHGPNGNVFGRSLIDVTPERARTAIASAFPQLDDRLLEDLLPLMLGNAKRVHDLKHHPRDLTGLDHHERIIALGQDFSWLARQNFALIINDIDPNLDFAIETAAKIIKKNLEGTAPDDRATLFTNIPYRKPGMEEREARVASIELQEFAQGVIKERHPDLWASGKLLYLVSVTFASNKKMTVIDQGMVGG